MNQSAEDLGVCLKAGATASGVLGEWCTRRFGPGSLTAEVLEDQEIESGRRRRRVELHWQNTAVSHAENIYLPMGLPENVRHRLLHTTVPFGVLLDDIGLVRRTEFARVLPAGGPFVLEIRAVLSLPEQGDVAYVHEFYRRSLLDL